MKKAYQVTEPEEGNAVIVFAEKNVVARRNGANELDIDFTEVESCVRKPQFDEFAAAGEVPVKALLADGWWFECGNCGRRVDEGGCMHDEDYEQAEHAPHIDGRAVFCDIDCFEADSRQWIEDQRRKQALYDMINERYPGATAIWANAYHKDIRVAFKFPGGKGPVEWRGSDNTLWLYPDDLQAWESFTGKPFDRIE